MKLIEKYLNAEEFDHRRFEYSQTRYCKIVKVVRMYAPIGNFRLACPSNASALRILDVYVLGIKVWHRETETAQSRGTSLFSYKGLPFNQC